MYFQIQYNEAPTYDTIDMNFINKDQSAHCDRVLKKEKPWILRK